MNSIPIRHDYMGRPVCASCGHTRAMHKLGSICAIALCYCREYLVLPALARPSTTGDGTQPVPPSDAVDTPARCAATKTMEGGPKALCYLLHGHEGPHRAWTQSVGEVSFV